MVALMRALADIFDRRARRGLILAAAGTVLIAIFDTVAVALVLPLVDLASGGSVDGGPTKFVADLIGTSDRVDLTVVLSAAVVVLFVLKDVGTLAFVWWSNGFVYTQRIHVSASILRYYLSAPYSEISRRSAAELMRTMDASAMQLFTFTVAGLMNALSSLIAIIAVVVALAILAPVPMTVILVYFGAVAWIYLRIVRPRALRAGAIMSEASMRGWRSAFAALGAMKEVNLRGSQDHFVGRFRDAQLAGALSARSAHFFSTLPKYILEICFILAVGSVLVFSAGSPVGSSSVLGEIALFVAAGFRVLPSVTTLVGSLSSIRVGTDSLEIVREELLRSRRASQAVGPTPEGEALPDWSEIRLEGVSYSYPGASEQVLRDIDLAIPRGTSLALVGPSGAGKTTLVDLILGLHRPTTGCMTLDGANFLAGSDGWRSAMGYVPQDVYVLDATLAENVAFDQARDRIDPDRLRRALKAAQLEDVVDQLPEKVDTWLGERGVRLSGGQRQRVGIARALYRAPEVLVLDEATSALDNETEDRVSSTIRGLAGEVTLIIVAHRLSTVRDVDQIAFMKDGTISARGSFEELRATSPDFARLVALGTLEPTN